MPQDAFTLKYVCKELNNLLVGGKISKINQPERDELSIIIYTKTGSVKLEISASAKNNGITLSNDEKPNPKVAPNFCMLLRKHLQNAEITDVAQVGFERIIYFDFKCFSEFEITEMRMYCEIMGKYSNVILVEKGIILGAMKQTTLEENTRRILFSGAPYTLPAPQEKADPTNMEELERIFQNKNGEVAKFISNNVSGIAYTTALEMEETFGEGVTAKDVYDYVNNSVAEPCLIYENGAPSDFKVRSLKENKKSYPDILSAQRDYYSYVYKKAVFENEKRRAEGALRNSVKKLEKRLLQINSQLSECEAADEIKLKGELITANIYRIERGMDSFEAMNYYDENCAMIKIELDKRMTPSQNAQRYYKKYAKLKRTVTNLGVQKTEVESKIDYLSSIKANIATAERIDDLIETIEELATLGFIKKEEDKKKKQKAPILPFRTYEIGGFKVYAGRNNVQNDRLLKTLSFDDIWVHTQKYHSSHVGIITEGKRVPDEVILVASEICAYYSDGAGKDKIPVDHTLKKYVKKPPKADLGFVIYTDQETLLVSANAHYELLTEDKENEK